MGVSTVNCIAHDPCLVLSESDSNLYTKFEYYEKKIHRKPRNL